MHNKLVYSFFYIPYLTQTQVHIARVSKWTGEEIMLKPTTYPSVCCLVHAGNTQKKQILGKRTNNHCIGSWSYWTIIYRK